MRWPPRRGLFRLHGWLGVPPLLLLILVFTTGCLAAISPEIDWLLRPALRAAPAPGRPAWGAALAAVAAAYPGATVERLAAPADRWSAVAVTLVTAEGGVRIAYADPRDGHLQGDGGPVTASWFLRNLHRRLFMPETVGQYIVCTLAVLLLGSVASGLAIHPGIGRSLRRPRVRLAQGGRILLGDAHRLVAAWSLWIGLLVAVTGSWYLVERALTDAGWRFDDDHLRLAADRLATLGDAPRWQPLDRLVASAESALPGLRVRAIDLPDANDQPITLIGQGSAWLVRDRATRVLLDPFDGRVLAVRRPSESTLFQRWVATVEVLHFGSFGGLPSRAVWCAGGAGLVVVAVSGGWLAARRRRTDLPSAAPVPRRPMLGLFTCVAAGVLAMAGWQASAELRRATAPAADRLPPPAHVGPWQVALGATPRAPIDATMHRVVVAATIDCGADCRPNPRHARLAITAATGTLLAAGEGRGVAVLRSSVRYAADQAAAVSASVVTLTLDSWDGTRYEVRQAFDLRAIDGIR